MATFASCPDAIIVELLTSWVSIKWCALIDSAFCSVHFRKNFLEIFSSSSFVLNSSQQGLDTKILYWLVCRNIKINFAWLGKKSVTQNSRYLLQLDKSQICAVSIHCHKSSESSSNILAQFINCCTSLVMVDCRSPSDVDDEFFESKINNSVWEKLETIQLRSMPGAPMLTDRAFQNLATKCTNLQTLSLNDFLGL